MVKNSLMNGLRFGQTRISCIYCNTEIKPGGECPNACKVEIIKIFAALKGGRI
jgi:hypothetical protein